MYAQVSDVKALAPSVQISDASQPNQGQVAQWIADVENTIVNPTLGAIGYKVPLTGPDSIAFARLVVAHLVMAMVMRARPNPEQAPENFETWATSRLKALRDPKDPFELPADAERINIPIKSNVVRVSSNLRDMLDDEPGRVHRHQVF